MLSIQEARRRLRRYLWSARGLTWTATGLLLLALLKGVGLLTSGYLGWIHPSAFVGYGVQWLCYRVQNLPVLGTVFAWMPALTPPSGLFHPLVLLCFSMFVSGGIAHRAAFYLKEQLTQALGAAQQAKWQAELLGDQPTGPNTTNIGNHVHIYSAPSVSPGPWWTRPSGLLLIAVVGGVASAVLGQWLNLLLGLVH